MGFSRLFTRGGKYGWRHLEYIGKRRSLFLGSPTWFRGFAALLLSCSIPCLLSLIQMDKSRFLTVYRLMENGMRKKDRRSAIWFSLMGRSCITSCTLVTAT